MTREQILQSTNEHSTGQDAAAHFSAAEQGSEAVTSTPEQQPKSFWRRLASPFYIFSVSPWLALASLLAQGVIASSLGTLTASLIGLLLVPLVAIGFGYYERWRLGYLGAGQVVNGHMQVTDLNTLDSLVFRLKEVATWREVGSLLVTGVWGVGAGALVVAQVTVIGSLIWLSYLIGWDGPVYYSTNIWNGFEVFQVPQLEGTYDLPSGYAQIDSTYWWLPLAIIPLALIVFAYLNGLATALGTSLSKLILSPRPEEFERQAAKLAESRTKIVDAFEGERRSIERNLHDGVQQELVNLNLRLGLAEMEAKNLVAETQSDRAVAVQQHITEARAQLSHAQMTLRDTVRGIYPAVLEDHGLRSALEELTRHSLLPVHLNYSAASRLPRDVERTAYYTVNEALTNTLKHAGASRLLVTVYESSGSLVVVAEDDGRGGANPEAGTGLSGLMERAAALGGTVQVDSPVTGTTRLTLVLPLNQ
ncbi:MAG: histidine kinase [Rothia sp. (in: high G+C Gram-positive bacteria)]|nr:histidine kinase [Rothia sp. (in: high G+C Gram-positive bacteria)]